MHLLVIPKHRTKCTVRNLKFLKKGHSDVLLAFIVFKTSFHSTCAIRFYRSVIKWS
jgi:hypothetical protein